MVYKKRLFLFYASIVLASALLSGSLLFAIIGNREIAVKKDFILGEARKIRGTVDFLFAKLRSDLAYISSRDELRDLEGLFERTDYRAKRAFFAGMAGLSLLSDFYDEAVVFRSRTDLMIDLKNALVARVGGSRLEHKIRAASAFMGSHPAEREALVSLTIDGTPATYLIRAIELSPRGDGVVIMVQLSEGFFQAVLNDIFLVEGSYLLILNQNGELVQIRAKDGGRAAPADYLSLIPAAGAEPTGPRPTSFAGKGRFLVGVDESPENKWRYYYGIDYYRLRAETFLLLLRYSVIVVLSMALCLLAARRLSLKLYEPVEGLLELLGQPGQAGMRDEFALIQANLKGLLRRNEDLLIAVSRNEPYARDAFLRSLVAGAAASEGELLREMGALGLSLPRAEGSRYKIYCCLVREAGEQEPRDSVQGEKDAILSYFSVGGDCESFMADDGLLVLIEGLAPGAGARPPAALAPADRPGSHPRIAIGASRARAGLLSLPEAYREARLALDYRSMFQGRGVIEYDEVVSRDKAIRFYPSAIEERLVANVKLLDREAAMDLYSQFTEAARKSGVAFGRMKRYYSHLLDTLAAILRDFDIALSAERYEAIRLAWESTEDADKVDDIDEALRSVIGILIEALRSSKESPSVAIANEAKAFIDESYGDRNLSLDLISARLRYSASHISAIFRETFGETIKNYITGLRLSRAKDLLASTGSGVAEVGSLVGYDNVGSFIKIFKAYIGETPKEYRLRIRGK